MFFESCRCSKDEAWRWWIGERRTNSIRIIFENERSKNLFFFIDRVNSNLTILPLRIHPYGKVCAVPGVQTYIFFFFTRKSGNLSQMYRECTRRGSVFGKGSRAIFHSERSAAIPARGRASETGVWNMARRVISAYLSAQRRGRNCFSEWKSSAPTRRERIPRHFFVSSRRCRQPPIRAISSGKFYRNSIEKLLTNTTSTFSFSPRLEIFCQDCATLLQICVCHL